VQFAGRSLKGSLGFLDSRIAAYVIHFFAFLYECAKFTVGHSLDALYLKAIIYTNDLIPRILGMRSYAKVARPVVSPVAVDVVESVYWVSPVNHLPDDAMNPVRLISQVD
jgi:hypothetical protein